jgi:hypothetical protein
MPEKRYLAIYLRDHLAGATGGVELARRAARQNQGSEFGAPLAALASEIEEDRAQLRAILRSLDVRPDPLKAGIAWGAEKAGRLKLNGELRGYSPLSRLVEIEALAGGVTGKLSLWRNLRAIAPAEPRLDPAGLDALAGRAEAQLDRLHELCRRAALLACAPSA